MTRPTSAPEPASNPQPAQQSSQDRDALQAAILAALMASLAPWLVTVAAAVLAGGAVAVAAVPLPSILIARTLTRIRPDVLRLWGRTSERFQAQTDGKTGPDRILQQIGIWIGSADEHAFTHLSQLLAQAQTAGWSRLETREQIRAALRPSAPHWQLWGKRTAELSAGYAVSATMAGVVAASGGVWTKTWISRLDADVRPTHVKAHGQTVPAAGTFLVGGWPMSGPHDPSAPIEETINCRCEPEYRRIS